METSEKAISFVPRPLLAWIANGVLEKRFKAVVAFADVSGFTAMSERLATIGREGAESLTAILNSYFSAMIKPIEEAGGFVGKFGGDAMTIFFPVDDGDDFRETARRAVAVTLDLQRQMSMFEDVKTKAGVFSLGMKIGVSLGDVLFQVVGEEKDGGREYLLAGTPLDLAAEAEHLGVSGQVILTPKIAMATGLKGAEVGAGFVRLDSNDFVEIEEYSSPRFVYQSDEWKNIARTFIDPPIFHRMALGMDSVGEIRHVSVIFMSFKGLDYDVDPDVGRKLDMLYEWIYNLTEMYGGSINKIDMGDKGSKMILTFGAPTARENDEELAVHCGYELVRGHNKAAEIGVEQHIGIASGIVFAGEVGAPSRQEFTVMGSVVNLSARIMARSKPGQLLVDENTFARTKELFDFAEPEFVQFKGIGEPMPVYCCQGVAQQSHQHFDEDLKPIIGRDLEVETILDNLKTVQSGVSKVMIVRGDPGAGKSRLAQEAVKFARERNFNTAAGEALTYAKRSPYLVWISILRKLMELPPAGSDGVLTRLEEVINEADPENVFRLPIIAKALGVECPENNISKHFDAELRQENLHDFLVTYLKFVSSLKPMLLLFEDCQWIDKNSLALIVYLIRNLHESPIFFVYARRHYSRKFKSPHIVELEKDEFATSFILKDISKQDTESLVLSVFDASGIDAELMNFIFDASNGNPSFTLQLIENLKSQGRIKIISNDAGKERYVEKVGDLSEVEAPESLSSLIMSQLDRLKPEAMLTVKLASAIGRQFKMEVVNGAYPVAMSDQQIRESLTELTINEILIEELDDDIRNYIFKNLLTLDVAYDSLLFAHRREYHKRIGVCLESIYEDNLSEWIEELARHFSQSEDDGKAIKYLGKAGDKAFDLYANESAESYYTTALERATSEVDPIERIRLLRMRSEIYSTMGRRDLQKQDLDETLELTEEFADIKDKCSVLCFLARYYEDTHQLDEMKDALDQAEEILKQIDNPFISIQVNNNIGNWLLLKGKTGDALERYKISISEAERVDDKTGLAAALTNCGLSYKGQGDFNKALEYYERSLELDRVEGNLKSQAVNLRNIGVLHYQRGAYDQALVSFQEALKLARSIGSKQLQSTTIGNLAVINQYMGQRTLALELHEENLIVFRKLGFPRGECGVLLNIGAWRLEHGDFTEAISYFNQALEMVVKHSLKGQEPKIKVNMGQALHYQGDLNEARRILEDAINTSVENNNKLAEDYARRYLGFVLIDQGELTLAEKEFNSAREIATAVGSKASLASVKVGLGIINMLLRNDRILLDEGIAEASALGDTEVVIKGKTSLAKILAGSGQELREVLDLLTSALEVAESGGFGCDVKIIKPLIEKIEKEIS